MNEVLNVIKSRRSVRAYKPEQIKDEELSLILEAATYAPSGINTQPWHFTVIQNSEIIKKMNAAANEVMSKSESEWVRNMAAKNSDLTYAAPTLIIVSGKKDTPSGIADCSAAIQNILLSAESLNIGSVWLGLITECFRIEGEAEKIGIPEGYRPFFGVALGYKQRDEKTEAPERKKSVVNYIK